MMLAALVVHHTPAEVIKNGKFAVLSRKCAKELAEVLRHQISSKESLIVRQCSLLSSIFFFLEISP